MTMYRQGDLLIVPVNQIKGKKQKDKVLALGEVTGHMHQVLDGDVLRVSDDEKYLDLPKPTKLVHDEHRAIDLPAGKYKVTRQREYKPALKKKVQPIID